MNRKKRANLKRTGFPQPGGVGPSSNLGFSGDFHYSIPLSYEFTNTCETS
jgi:hypothetical protein